MRAWPWLRGGLWFLTALEVGLAGVILLFPRWFFSFRWVNLGMPYNEHLLLDFGAANLAMAVVLGAAAVLMERRLVVIALAGFLVLAGIHFVIHTRYADHLPPADSAALLTALAIVAIIPAGLLALTRKADLPVLVRR